MLTRQTFQRFTELSPVADHHDARSTLRRDRAEGGDHVLVALERMECAYGQDEPLAGLWRGAEVFEVDTRRDDVGAHAVDGPQRIRLKTRVADDAVGPEHVGAVEPLSSAFIRI